MSTPHDDGTHQRADNVKLRTFKLAEWSHIVTHTMPEAPPIQPTIDELSELIANLDRKFGFSRLRQMGRREALSTLQMQNNPNTPHFTNDGFGSVIDHVRYLASQPTPPPLGFHIDAESIDWSEDYEPHGMLGVPQMTIHVTQHPDSGDYHAIIERIPLMLDANWLDGETLFSCSCAADMYAWCVERLRIELAARDNPQFTDDRRRVIVRIPIVVPQQPRPILAHLADFVAHFAPDRMPDIIRSLPTSH